MSWFPRETDSRAPPARVRASMDRLYRGSRLPAERNPRLEPRLHPVRLRGKCMRSGPGICRGGDHKGGRLRRMHGQAPIYRGFKCLHWRLDWYTVNRRSFAVDPFGEVSREAQKRGCCHDVGRGAVRTTDGGCGTERIDSGPRRCGRAEPAPGRLSAPAKGSSGGSGPWQGCVRCELRLLPWLGCGRG